MTDPISLSALNHYAYCPRRCALIHVEQEFEENVHTQRGSREHERVDVDRSEAGSAGARREFSLPIWSDRFGLVGKCDVVEFHPNGTLYPVEHKHGPRRRWLNDDIQLCAQAMCLEEMFGRAVPRGAIFHASSKRRREVVFTPELRAAVESTVTAVREMLDSRRLPPPVNDARCDECSLKPRCVPAVPVRRRADWLFRPLPEAE
jgi:CRISPR-associated exonuclease Cas4